MWPLRAFNTSGFEAALSYLQSAGIELEVRHCCNSGATLLYPEYAMDMVRPGIMTYGLCPSPDTAGILDLEPVLRLYTTVSQIRTFPAGVDVSYGRTYTTKREQRLAVLSHRLCRRAAAQPFGQGGVSCSTASSRRWWGGSAWTCAWWM